MNQHGPGQTFEAARRQHLIEATIEALADVGFKAASLSQIARRAKVSTGLFAHYFGDKEGLLEATLRFMAARLRRATIRRLRSARDARERLFAVADSALAEEEFDRRTSAVWLAFWGQITHSTRYQRVQSIYQRRMLSNLRHDLRALVPVTDVEIRATMIAAMIDGLWIRSHASATQPDGADARRIVHALIDSLIAGCTASLPQIPPVAKRADTGRPPVVATASAVLRTEIAAVVERAARGQREWHAMAISERRRTLRCCAEGLLADGSVLARLDAVETGRACTLTADLFVPRAARIFERWSEFVVQSTSERIDLGSGGIGDKTDEPFGVVCGRGHWSAPIFDVCRQVAPALALGNAMVFQAADAAEGTAVHLIEILRRAGMPDGVFGLLRSGEEAWRALIEHPGVAPRSMADAVARSATVVLRDADLDDAADAVLSRCGRWQPSPDLSETPVFVAREVLTPFLAHLTRRAERLRVGDPLLPATEIGRVVSSCHREQILALIDDAVHCGAHLICVDSQSNTGPNERLLAPMIVAACTEAMPIVHGRVHGPVVPVLAFDSVDELVGRLDALSASLAVGFFTADSRGGRRIAKRLRASLCCINDGRGPSDDSEGFVAWEAQEKDDRRFRRRQHLFAYPNRHEAIGPKDVKPG